MPTKTYRNPLPIRGIGDPFVLKAANGRYYLYPTSAGNEGYKAWTSVDLVNWEEIGFVYRKTDTSWGYKQFWAPEVVEYQGKYYMYYTARWKEKESLRIGVAVAEQPEGPFRDVLDRPLFDFGYAAIDANVLIDDDGRKYLYYSRDCSEQIIEGRHESHIYGVRLGDDMVSVSGEPVLLAKPDQEWERKSGPDWFWNEGPFVLKRDGIYYLMYSANFYGSKHYAVGYATSSEPLGPFTKYDHNPILSHIEGAVSGPGHNSAVLSPDGREWFIVYHTHTDLQKGGGNRQVCIDRMHFREDGSLYVSGPTIDEQPIPGNKHELNRR
jgi:GH43 family beta-xylosidase